MSTKLALELTNLMLTKARGNPNLTFYLNARINLCYHACVINVFDAKQWHAQMFIARHVFFTISARPHLQ